MSKKRLACPEHRCFVDQFNRRYAPGQLLSQRSIDEIGEERINQLIAKGAIVILEVDEPDVSEAAERAAAVAAEAAAKKAAEKAAKKAQADAEKAAKKASAAAAPPVIPSKLVLDPADLAEMPLDDLNLLALDLGHDGDEFVDAEAAIAYLSKDYRG
jgi:hypothetical protein